ncbi:MAG: TonB-dependent receptor [Woeseiaceae bacterium]|nr:TonB-dependent receptor [Woeseiaceae bacterium]
MKRLFKRMPGAIACLSTAAAAFVLPATALGQEGVLDEITVTAQRREQSLQDVPISIQTFSGDQMDRQGFVTLNELSAFSPGLVIKDFSEEQGLILRGAGTQSKNLGVEQGVPTFVDGVHFGRGSQVKSAYMDIERIEVLKGPQPVFFGQNAAAGALNITTRKPTAEWEGDVSGEYGSFGRGIFEVAAGGPITDSLGVRVAAKHYRLEGFMKDFRTGKDFPERETNAGRVTLQWTPNERFTATLKGEYADNDLGPRVWPVMLDKFSDDPFLDHPERVIAIGISSENVPGAIERGFAVGEVRDLGWQYIGPFIDPWEESVASGIPLTEASGSENGVVYNWNECLAAGGLQILEGGMNDLDPIRPAANPGAGRQPQRPSQFESCNMTDESASRPWHAILDLDYSLASGIELTSKTAFSAQTFYNTPHNSGGGAFASNPRSRGEEFQQWSQEFRVSSPVGGKFEWMTGLYYQNNDLYVWSDAYRANSRRSIRTARGQEYSEWTSVFATVTFNFWGDKGSLDIGGRYTDIDKEAVGANQIAEWFVRNDVEGGGDGSIIRVPYGLDVTSGSNGAASQAFLDQYPGLVNGSIVGRTPFTDNRDDMLGRTHPAGSVSSSRVANVSGTIEDDSFDPQVVFRYRPHEALSYYVKFATSFKSGAFDMGVSEFPRFEDTFSFGPEEYEIWEVGVRGTFLDGRLQAEATAYTTDITGVQVSFIDRILDRNITKNIAEQTSDGLEFSLRYLAGEKVTLSLYGALLDATVDSFPDAVCTEDERITGRCREEDDPEGPEGTIDRSGSDARNAPDWQFTGNIQWELPSFVDGYRTDLDLTLMATSDYITDRSFSRVVDMGQEEDINVSVRFGPEEGPWSFMVYGRNLLEPKPRYNPQFDLAGDGVIGSEAQVTTVNYASYGARFNYSFE